MKGFHPNIIGIATLGKIHCLQLFLLLLNFALGETMIPGNNILLQFIIACAKKYSGTQDLHSSRLIKNRFSVRWKPRMESNFHSYQTCAPLLNYTFNSQKIKFVMHPFFFSLLQLVRENILCVLQNNRDLFLQHFLTFVYTLEKLIKFG